MPAWAWLVIGIVAGADVARKILDWIARARHWRVGPVFGPVLCIWRRKRSRCFRCWTDWRWALPHFIPIAEAPRLEIFPICQRCWEETDKTQRLSACADLMNEWIAIGRYSDGDSFDQERYDEERVAIYYAVEAGL